MSFSTENVAGIIVAKRGKDFFKSVNLEQLGIFLQFLLFNFIDLAIISTSILLKVFYKNFPDLIPLIALLIEEDGI